MSPQTIIFIGRSGCGKSTQAKLLAEYIEKQTLIVDRFIKLKPVQSLEVLLPKTISQAHFRRVYENVEKQPDFLAITMWTQAFIDNLTGEEHVMIDGARALCQRPIFLMGHLIFMVARLILCI